MSPCPPKLYLCTQSFFTEIINLASVKRTTKADKVIPFEKAKELSLAVSSKPEKGEAKPHFVRFLRAFCRLRTRV